MIKTISASSGVVYRHAVKPLLFRFQPDIVHERMLRVGVRMERAPLVCSAARGSLAYRNSMLVQRVAGIDFVNPVGLSAGFDKNMVLVPLMKSIGFGFMEGGSITLEPCAGNVRPWFHRLPYTKSLVVHVGLANEGSPTIVRRIREYPKETFRGFPLNISVAKTNSPNACSEADAIDDYIGSLEIIHKFNAGSMITLNISCPNTFGGEPFTTPERLEHLLARVDALKLPRPVFIKMPIDLSWPAFNALLKVADKHVIAGVTIGNLAKDRSKIKLSDPLPEDVEGGLSGRPTFHKSNELIRQTRRAYGERFVIIGVGGIFSAEDAYIKIRLGASLVELITGMIFEGPQLVGQINRDLVRLLKRDGYANISQAVGVAV